ncbi:Lipopolysaccharide-responsive and beige-like anchor protein, partial [Megadyptes antipodes antipodes]
MCHHLIMAAKYRDQVTATQLIQKIINILTDKHGAWGSSAPSRPREFWRLDYWEDDLRRRRRFVRNPLGSTHPEATLKAAGEHGQGEGKVNAGTGAPKRNKKYFHEQCMKYVCVCTSFVHGSFVDETQLVFHYFLIVGFLSVLSFKGNSFVENRIINLLVEPNILAYTEGLHGKWLFSEIRSIFSRRYLLQNTALEIFMANRVGVMFNFPDQATVKKVVNCLPRVGIGTIFGLPQTRYFTI